jgi:hypothetical protein
MKKRTIKLLQFALLFSILTGFTLMSIGAVQSKTQFVQAVSAAKESNPANGVYIGLSEQAFESKVLRFLQEEKVCALTQEQAQTLAQKYSIETKELAVDGESVSVLYVEGNPLSKKILEQAIGEKLADGNCQVVHGNKIVAVLSPAFVS